MPSHSGLSWTMAISKMQSRVALCISLLLLVACSLPIASARSSVLAAASLPRSNNNNNSNNNNSNVQRRRLQEDQVGSFPERHHGTAIPSGGAVSVKAATTATAAATAVKSSTAPWVDGLKNGLASAMAAACVKATLMPVDAIKTLQQYQQTVSGKSLTISAACNQIMTRPGGFANFYAGLGVTVFGAMPGVALYFGVYSYVKRLFLETETGKNNKTLSIALSAAIGNSVASFSRVPYEVMKQKLQTQAYSSTWQAFREIASHEAWWTLLFPKGSIAVQMIRDVPYAVCTLLLYESLQTAFSKEEHSRTLDFFIGGTAGGLGSWMTNPMDVIKTRLQIDSGLYQGSVVTCTRAVWGEGGAPAFLRGSIPRLMHKVPANAFFFLFYELFRRALGVGDAIAKQEAQKSKSGPQKKR